MDWSWKRRANGGEAPGVAEGKLYHALFGDKRGVFDPNEPIADEIKRLEARSDAARREFPMDYPPDFTGSMVVAIELLKRGAPAVDIVHFGLRVRTFPDGLWEIGPIPQRAIDRHTDMFATPIPSDPPIAGEEEPNAPSDTDKGESAGMGAAPENA